MKKAFITIGLALTMGASVMAQGQVPHFEFKSFLNVQAFQTGTNSLHGFTNLFTPTGAGYAGTNEQGLLITNLTGTANTIGPGTNDYLNVFKDIDLWALRNGDWPVMWNTNNQQAEYLNNAIGMARLVVRGVSTNAAGTGPVVFRFVPLWDGTNESTLAGDVWSVSFVPNGVTAFCLTTNFPLQRFVGARRLRLREEYNTSASNQGQTWIYELGVSAWIP